MKIKVLIDGEIKVIKIPYTKIFLLWLLGFLGYGAILGVIGLILSLIP